MNLEFNLHFENDVDIKNIINILNELDCIEIVLPIPKPIHPPTPPNYESQQLHLKSPSQSGGINAWNLQWGYNVRGENINVVDIEYEFESGHLDLPNINILSSAGSYLFGTQHAIGCYGTLCSKENEWGTTGISQNASYYFASSYVNSIWDISTAITTSLSYLNPGDVIIIQQQYAGPNYTGTSEQGLIPIEWYKPWYDSIVTAIGNGIIVIEAAGNGSENLDSAIYSTGNNGHYPFLTENDSGAIIVGAGNPTTHECLNFSTYGSRVNLQGWGLNVITTSYGDLYNSEGVNLYYTDDYNGTSSATAIVGGAVTLCQSALKKYYDLTLSSLDMRSILSITGTEQTGIKNIGNLPNVYEAFKAFGNIRPDNFSWLYPKIQGQTFNITAKEWNMFNSRINAFRYYKDLTNINFIEAVKGNNFTSTKYNETRNAIFNMNTVGLPSIKNTGDIFQASYLNDLVTTLNNVV